jgi:mRNA-decapping enzyme 1B
MLQPFPPPTPPPSLTPSSTATTPLISRDKVRDALLMLIQVLDPFLILTSPL